MINRFTVIGIILFTVIIKVLFDVNTMWKTRAMDRQNNGKCEYSCFEGKIKSYRMKHRECKCITNDEVVKYYNL